MHRQSATSSQSRRPSSENSFGLDGTYLHPTDQVPVKMEPQEYSPPTTIGLGIMQDVAGLPVTQPLSVHGWPNQAIVGTSACFGSTAGAPDYGSLSYYQHQQYPSGPIVNPPLMRFSDLSPCGQTTPVYYNANLNARSSNSPVYHEPTRWPITPQSQLGTPIQYANQESHSDSPIWEASLSPAITNTSHPPMVAGQGLSDLALAGENPEYLKRSPSADGSESIPESKASRQASVEGSTSSESLSLDLGLHCDICGKRFTRRANCQDHIKRHDPKQRPSYSCSECGRTFGRKTDLKRHYSTRVHDGEKKFPCGRCGRSYSRLDTLHRHNKIGCPERKRKPSPANKGQSYKFKPFQVNS